MIPDAHSAPAGWGVRPVLVSIGGQSVSSYAFFVLLGLVLALALYWFNTRGKSVGNNALYIALGASIGGVLGSKIPMWIVTLPQLFADPSRLDPWLSGRTIVGGIVGGVLGVWLVKRQLHITQRLGNYLVPSLALGIAVGRVGCFFAGCCYGTATTLPWGVNFGDEVLRHPTQLYEAFFVFGIFLYAQWAKDRYEPGVLFRRFMIWYFGWRFAIEFIRVNPTWVLGLSYYQVAALAIVAAYLYKLVAGSTEGVRRWT